MTHEYSVEVQDYITQSISEAEKRASEAMSQSDMASTRFHRGQLRELQHIRRFLTERIDLETQKYY